MSRKRSWVCDRLPEAFAGGKVSSKHQRYHEGEPGGGWAISPLSLVSLGGDGVAPGSKIIKNVKKGTVEH